MIFSTLGQRMRYLSTAERMLIACWVFFGAVLLAAALALIISPVREQRVRIAADFQPGGRIVPINLPEPAAGDADPVRFQLQLPPEKPVEAAETPQDVAAEPQVAPPTPTAELPSPPPKPARVIVASLSEDSGTGPLPRISPEGLRPFEAYQSPHAPEDTERARIGIIIAGLGLSTQRSNEALEALPPTVSVAISPYARTPQSWADQALAGGHDLLLMVPMEPNSFPTVDPGPDTLMRDAPAVQTLERLHTVMAKFQGYVGLINDTGSRFTANAQALRPVLDDVAKRGIMVVDARASAYSVLASEAKKRDIPVAVNTRFLDESLNPNDITRQLRDLERTAETIGSAVGILRTFPVSLKTLAAWQDELDETRFVLAPISAIANTQPIR